MTLVTGIMFSSKTLFHGAEEQSTEFYRAGIYALIRRWNIAIERNVAYVEK